MPRRPLNLDRKIQDVLRHTDPLPQEAASPHAHYERAAGDVWNLRLYVERGFSQLNTYATVRDKHLAKLNALIVVDLIEAFERFVKELAAVCVDQLAPLIVDDRFDEFKLQGSVAAAHFQAQTIGKALCESSTWLDCKQINTRFRSLLADPFKDGDFFVFPGAQQAPVALRDRLRPMSVLWQLRHTIVHNVGVLTHSDAYKFRLLTQSAVDANCVVMPTRDDVRYVKRFLDETARAVNDGVGARLAELLTTLLVTHHASFDPQKKADELAAVFRRVVVVGGKQGSPP